MRRNDRVRAHTPPTVACCGVRRIRRRRIREDCRSGRVCRDLESSKRERTPGILWRRRDSRVVRIAEWRVRRFSPLLFLRSRARARARAEGFVEYANATSWFSHRADNRRLPLSIIVPLSRSLRALSILAERRFEGRTNERRPTERCDRESQRDARTHTRTGGKDVRGGDKRGELLQGVYTLYVYTRRTKKSRSASRAPPPGVKQADNSFALVLPEGGLCAACGARGIKG
ncbi:hypothetical protein PUN28_017944 [Cardiocondyla obscurior]|uniref:Uncharacterized protein n=1 Tax=Cardiocondyla obscurior TaxID=286306 RepID=A0AAW2EL60_9HYME